MLTNFRMLVICAPTHFSVVFLVPRVGGLGSNFLKQASRTLLMPESWQTPHVLAEGARGGRKLFDLHAT